MHQKDFTFNEAFFNKIFPFYILLDENLQIKCFGKSIAKLVPELNQKPAFSNVFKIIRPYVEEISTESFDKSLEQLVIISVNVHYIYLGYIKASILHYFQVFEKIG